MDIPSEDEDPENFLPEKEVSGVEKYIHLLLDEKDKRIQEKQERIEEMDDNSGRVSALKKQVDRLRDKLREKQHQINELEEKNDQLVEPKELNHKEMNLQGVKNLREEKERLEKQLEKHKELDRENLNKLKEISEENRRLREKLEELEESEEEFEEESEEEDTDSDSDEPIIDRIDNYDTLQERTSKAVEIYWQENDEDQFTKEICKEIFGEELGTSDSRYNRVVKKLKEMVNSGNLYREKRGSSFLYSKENEVEKDTEMSQFTTNEVQNMLKRKFESSGVLHSAKDLLESISDTSWINATSNEKQKIYNALNKMDSGSVKIQEKGSPITKYQLEGFNFEEQKTKENYSKMIDGQPLYEHIKVAVGKALPEEGESDVISYEEFTDHLALENTDQDFEVWQSLYTDNSLVNTIRKDIEVDFEVKFTKKSSGTAVTAKHYQMEIYR